MTTETPAENTEQATPEQQESQAQSAFEAGFGDVRGEESPQTETPPSEPEKPAAAPAAEATPPARDDKGQFKKDEPNKESPSTAVTADDLKLPPEMMALLERVPGLEEKFNLELNRVVGKFGNFQGRLDRIEKLLTQTAGKKLQPGALKRLKQEFPELAAVLEPDLLEALTAPDTQPQLQNANAEVDVDTRIKNAVATALADERVSTQKTVLSVLHPDWQKLSVDPEFVVVARDAEGNAVKDDKGRTIVVGGWLATIPPAEREKYQFSDDALVISQVFQNFKDWKKQQQKQTPPAGGEKTQKSSQRNQQRLEAAVAPTGDGRPPTTALDDDAAFLEGFKEVRGNRG